MISAIGEGASCRQAAARFCDIVETGVEEYSRGATRAARRAPGYLFADNGSEFTGHLVDLWAYHHGVRIDFSRPGKPTDNAFIETFNGSLRDESLNMHWFDTIAQVRGNDGGTTLVALREGLEQQLGVGRRQRDVAEFTDEV